MIDLSHVRTIGDFSIELRDRKIAFIGDGERIAGFPAWENADRDLRHFIAADVPLGSIDVPCEDFDEGWRIAILEHEGFVYVLEADDPHAESYPRRYRISRDAYIRAWAMLLHQYNPVLSLEELLANAGRSSDV